VLALNATTLLTAWEQGVSQPPLQRAMTLLALAWPQKSVAEWASVSIGERDRQLLQLRDELFGSKLEAIAVCPECEARLQLAFSTQDLQMPATATATDGEPRRLQSGPFEVDYRLPTSADLLEVANNPDQAKELLLERCVDAQRDGVNVPAADLPDQLVKLLGRKMAQADPQAEVLIALDCPACAHHWSIVFDILPYLWGEIQDWAERLLHDVHSLARAYGWSERDIIAMSARRRRCYLEMVQA
jgi:hypothetical protein